MLFRLTARHLTLDQKIVVRFHEEQCCFPFPLTFFYMSIFYCAAHHKLEDSDYVGYYLAKDEKDREVEVCDEGRWILVYTNTNTEEE